MRLLTFYILIVVSLHHAFFVVGNFGTLKLNSAKVNPLSSVLKCHVASSDNRFSTTPQQNHSQTRKYYLFHSIDFSQKYKNIINAYS